MSFYEDFLARALPVCFDASIRQYAAFFATCAKAEATNNARITNMRHTVHIAKQLKIANLLPDLNVTPEDAALAVIATKYAIHHYYKPDTIATKTYACSPLVIQDHSKYPFTGLVLKGIRALKSVEKPVGVVMGKYVLAIFNSTLQPTKYYYDLLLVTFDWICTTTVCRTGELAPVLSKPGAEVSIVTLGSLKIGST